MKRIDLPGGQWAEIRGPDELKVRHRKTIRAAAFSAGAAISKLPDDLPTDPVEAAKIPLSSFDLTYEEAERIEALQEATVVAFLSAWSLDEALPTMSTVGDMDPDLFDAIALATRSEGATIISDAAFDPTPEDVPGNPTGSSGDSDGHSKATETAEISTPPSVSDTPSSTIAV